MANLQEVFMHTTLLSIKTYLLMTTTDTLMGAHLTGGRLVMNKTL